MSLAGGVDDLAARIGTEVKSIRSQIPSGASTTVYPLDEYGAVGDGTTDDTTAIAAALAAAAAAGGGRVELGRGKKHGWSGTLTVPQGVCLAGQSTQQNLATDAAPTAAGLVALSANAQLRIGDWGGAAGPAGVSNLYVDGNFVGGDTPAKEGLVRIAGVNILNYNLFVSRSAGDGIVYDGVQNSTVLGGMSSQNVGSALVMDNGAGAISFLGGYYGSSKGGLLEMRDTAGEANMYPFGPTQNTWTGTIFESYTNQAAPIDEPYEQIVHVSGTHNHFTNCNFTGGATNNAGATVLIDNAALPLIPTTVTLDDCLFWVKEGYDAIRVVGSAQVTLTGAQNVGDDGTNHAVSFICIDGGSPHISMQGEVLLSGDVHGTKMFRTVNGGTTNGVYTIVDSGRISRLRESQTNSVRREGDTAPRQQINKDGAISWWAGAPTSTSLAYIQRGADGTGKGLDYWSAAGGEHRFLGGPVRVTDLYFGESSTPFTPGAGSGGDPAEAKDDVLLERLEKQVRQRIDTYNHRNASRAVDADVFTEIWESTSAWTGTATVADGRLYNSPGALNHPVSVPVGSGRGMVRTVLSVPASNSNFAYLGVNCDPVGAAAVGTANTMFIGVYGGAFSALQGAYVTGTLSGSVGGAAAAGDYILTAWWDEISISMSIQPKTNPGVTFKSMSFLRSQMPGGKINNILISNNNTTGTLAFGPLIYTDDCAPPPVPMRSPNGIELFGKENPIHISAVDPGHQTVVIAGSPTGGTFTLTYAGKTTTALPYNVTGPAMKDALEALSTVGVGNVQVNRAPSGGGGYYAVRLKGDLGMVAMTQTSSLTGGSSPTVTVAPAVILHLATLPGDYDPRVPLPIVEYLHWASSGSATTPYLDARMTDSFTNLIDAGYAFLSSDNGPLVYPVMGLQDSYGNQYGIDDYESLVEWFRSRFNTGTLFLYGTSQGGFYTESILASRTPDALGNIGAAIDVSPGRDIIAVGDVAAFKSQVYSAWGATDQTSLTAAVEGMNSIAYPPKSLRGVPHRDYVVSNDPYAPREANTDPLFAALEGYVPEADITAITSSAHLDAALFVLAAADVVDYFNTYNVPEDQTPLTPSGEPAAKRVSTVATAATFTLDSDNYDVGVLTAQAGALTIAAPTGTPRSMQSLILRIKDNGTARAVTWDAAFRAIGVALPTTTVAGKTTYVGAVWNITAANWDVIAVAQEA